MAKLFKTKTIEQHAANLASFLPEGNAFVAARDGTLNFGKLINALAEELMRVYTDINNVSEDYDLLVTQELLSNWEDAVGIPDSIFPGTGSQTTRRLHALIKFAKMHIQTAPEMAALVTALGFTNVDIQPLNNLAYPPYNVPFYPTSNPESRYIIVVYATGIFLEVPPYDVPFTPASNSGGLMNLILELVKPQNTEILFRTDEANVIIPTSIAGCIGWLDASDVSTVTLSGLNLVDTLAAKTGDIVAAGGATQPTWVTGVQNGKGILRFNNAQAMELTGSGLYEIPTGDFTMFVVIKQNTASATDYIISYSNGGVTDIENLRYVSDDATFNSLTAGSASSTSDFEVIRTRRSGVNQYISINDGAETTDATWSAPGSAVDAVYIGANFGTANFLIADIGEIIIYNRSLSATERTQIENYLSTRWAI